MVVKRLNAEFSSLMKYEASSARAVSLISSPSTLTPLILGSDLISMNRISRDIMNSKGLKGSPCLVDLRISDFSDKNPLFEIQLLAPFRNI